MLRRPTIKRPEVILLLAFVSLYSACADPIGPRRRVLLVYHTNGAIPSNIAFEQALTEDLREKFGPTLDFYREQLDSDRFPGRMAEKIAILRSKYADLKIDAVIFSGNVPTEIVAEAPVVQIDNGLPERTLQSAYGNNSVHVRFDIDPMKIVEVAKRLQPQVRKVLLISGASEADRIYLKQFYDRLKANSNLVVEAMDNASIPELIAVVSHLPRDVMVLPISYFRDPQGQSYVPREVLGQLAAVSTVPMYAVSDTYIGKGLLGVTL